MTRTSFEKVNPIVEEVLTLEEVNELWKSELNNSRNPEDYAIILKGEYITWDGEKHIGYIVDHITYRVVKTASVEGFEFVLQDKKVVEHEYFFMEVTLDEEVVNPKRDCHYWRPTFHKLLPISDNSVAIRDFKEGTIKDFCKFIAKKAMKDNWRYIEVPMTKEEIQKDRKYNILSNRTTKPCPLCCSAH